MNTQDRFIGCLLGLAVGDALGYPVEFLTLEQIKEKLGPQGVTSFDSLKGLGHTKHPIGAYSDDTQMTLATLRGLLRAKNPLDLEDVMKHVSDEYVRWHKSPDNNRSPGLTCMKGVQRLAEGSSWKDSGVPGEGCGAAMRVAPVGLLYSGNPHQVVLNAQAVGACTHRDSSAIQSGVAIAYAISDIISRADYKHYTPENLYLDIMNLRRDKKLQAKLGEIPSALRNPDEEKAMKSLGEGWTGHEAVAMALYSFLKSPTDYKSTVLRGANITGDSDSVASIAGAISGAYNGVHALPREFTKALIGKEEIIKLGKELYHKRINLEF